MKNILTLLSLCFILFSCSSDNEVGPQGPPGIDGLDGGLGWTFEETVDFDYQSARNHWTAFIDIPVTVDTDEPESDAVLVYRLEIEEATDGSDLDTWSLIPQNFFTPEGTIQYVYNHTVDDVKIFLDGNYDLSNVETGFTDAQTFRVVVLPSETFAANPNVDFSNYSEVMNTFNISDSNIIEVK